MFQLNNHTPFIIELHPTIDLHGRDFLVAIIKASYQISPLNSSLTLADEQRGIQHADEYYGEAEDSSIKLPSDLALAKPASDVILHGHAYAQNGRETRRCEVSIAIDQHKQSLAVTGDRVWHREMGAWKISPAECFERLPLRYENAYGGVDRSVEANIDSRDCCVFNPCGTGFFTKKSGPLEGMQLPNIENPQAMIESIDDRPSPASFGAIARNWEPRVKQAGTYDQHWQENRMPLLPMDFDLNFYNAAHPALRFKPHLRGDETISLTNTTETGIIAFQLPGERLSVTAKIRGEEKRYVTSLDTLFIEPDEHHLCVTWRSAISCAGKLLYVDSVDVKSEP